MTEKTRKSVRDAVLKGQQFQIQGNAPLAQSLHEPQLKRSYALHVAWQVAF